MWRKEVSLTQPHTKVMSGQRIFFLFSLNQSLTLHSSIQSVQKKKSALPGSLKKTKQKKKTGHPGKRSLWLLSKWDRNMVNGRPHDQVLRSMKNAESWLHFFFLMTELKQASRPSCKPLYQRCDQRDSRSHPTSQSTCQSESWSLNRCVTQ